MKGEQQIPCPVCATLIPFDLKQLITGVNFECPNCRASIGLISESKPIVAETIQKFDNTIKQRNNNGRTD